jgi:glycosyltransferase involved in cell wall biosynthesis
MTALQAGRFAADADPGSRSATGGGSVRLRVLLLTDELEIGGTQRQIVHLACGLDRNRFDVTVLYFRNPSAFVDTLRDSGVTVKRVDKRGAIDLAFVRALRRELAEGRYDVMHCFAFSGELWGAIARRLLPRALRPRLIGSVRGTYEWYSPWQWAAKKWVGEQCERVVANSRMGADHAARAMGWPSGRIEVVYNGVAPMTAADPGEAGAALRSALLGDAAGPLLLFVGRLVDHKDLPTLVRAFARLLAVRPGVRLAVAGDGPQRDDLTRWLAEAGVSAQVHLLGERTDVPALLAACDVLVLPSVREGLSNVVLEAMAAGRAVVASRAGGNPELVVDGNTGLLFDVGNDTALAGALVRLVDGPVLRRRLGEGGQERAEAVFGLDAMLGAHARMYGEPGLGRAGVALDGGRGR